MLRYQFVKVANSALNRRDWLKTTGQALVSVPAAAITIGVPVALYSGNSRRESLRTELLKSPGHTSSQDPEALIEDLAAAEKSAQLTYGAIAGTTGAAMGACNLTVEDSQRKELLNSIDRGLEYQPIDSKRIDHKRRSRRSFLKQSSQALVAAPIVGVAAGGAYSLASTALALPRRWLSGSPGEREMKAVDPKGNLDPKSRANHVSRINWANFLNKILFAGIPATTLVAAAPAFAPSNRELKNLNRLIQIANLSNRALRIKDVDQKTGTIICDLDDRDWYESKMDSQDRHFLNHLIEENFIKLFITTH